MSQNNQHIENKLMHKINGIKIDPAIFSFNFSCKCNGECCHYGVYTDLKEYEEIISIKDKIIPMMDESQTKDFSKWFEPPENDEDFESGVAVGTELFNNKCVFLDKFGLCTLQKLANNEGLHKWRYKPLYCILFPLTVYEETLTIDDEHINRLKTCNKHPFANSSIFEACREELIYFLGEKGFEELENYGKEFLRKQPSKNNTENSKEVA
jgi:Fe-S-cluster containining protein